MATQTTERPGLDEQYLVATNTSDLTLSADRVCSATHLIAAGLVGNRMGSILVHLQGEWVAAAKPPKPSDAEIEARAKLLPAKGGKADHKRARAVLLSERNRALSEA